MTKLPVAVIGCGHLGRIHARLLSQMENVQLKGVIDPHPAAREAVASQLNVAAYADIQPLLGDVRAVVVAAPTSLHTSIGLDLIRHGLHLLMEKPLAPSLAEAQQLAEAARRQGTVLAVGHVERFNPAFQTVVRTVDQQAKRPLLIEAIRSGPFTFRSMDSGVVMDLMIHDLELVLALVHSAVVGVTAVGAPVVTPHEDFAEARVQFANGCSARFFASRVTPSAQRRMTIFTEQAHLVADLAERHVQVIERCQELQRGQWQVDRWSRSQIETCQHTVFQKLLPISTPPVPSANPLLDELSDFVESVQQHREPRVSAQQGVRAVAVAEEVARQIREATQAGSSVERRQAA